MICTQYAGPKRQCFPPLCIHARQHPDDLLQHFHKRCSSSAVGGLWLWFTKHAHWPCELAPVTLLPLCLSLPWPDHTAPVTTVLALPTGYNYSAFCCTPFSLSHSSFLCLSLSQLGWVLTPRSRRRAAGPLLCVHNTLNATHCTVALNRWGVVMGKGEREGGGVTHLMPRPLGLREGGGGGLVGEYLLTSNPPTASALLSLSPYPVSYFILFTLSLSLSPWAASRSFVPAPPRSCPSACWRRDASELSTMEKRWRGWEQKIE